MSLMLAYKAIYQTAQTVALDIGKERLKDMPGNITVRDEQVQTQPLEVSEEPLFNVTGGYGNAILPGVINTYFATNAAARHWSFGRYGTREQPLSRPCSYQQTPQRHT